MCGIVGYIGTEDSALNVVVKGLQALEYRGYDSAGVAYQDGDQLVVDKQVGRVQTLVDSLGGDSLPVSQAAVGHTRWATHGTPTISNAHPHFNADKSIMAVHNGIIENYAELRSHLQKQGYTFVSETDTEVIPHLIDFCLRTEDSFQKAFEAALQELRGAYSIVVLTTHEPDVLYAARLSSPLVLGIADHGLIVASDASAIMEHTKQVLYVNDYEYIRAERSGSYHVIDFAHDAIEVTRETEMLDYDASVASKGDYPHFMLKEIYEAPQTIRSAMLGRIKAENSTVKLGGLDNVADQLKYIDRIVIVACGTSYYAGLVGEYLIEEIAGIPVEVQLASEFKYRSEPFSRGTALLAVSQSGETADTIAALKKVENYGVLRLGVVNAVGSTIARMTDAGVYCHAGPEQAVASTKAFIAQVTVLAEIALYLSRDSDKFKPVLQELDALPKKAEAVLGQADAIRAVAEKYTGERDFLFIGRGYGYPCALEGALKLKEVSYIHAEGYAAGEMKHGPLAMIDENFPTFAIAPDGPLLEKTISNIEEIRARNGRVVAIVSENDTVISGLANDVIRIPASLEQTSPLLVAIAMQLFSYYVATAKGLDVDKPRNLAKSVTVE